ncbi:hypothetical protein [uncultured Pseudokineococcus sp.]|uniref:hypothetical protein n=1 Tax=uncultured Pseudokineococcus sp. TaxID=1642928 RepID=UPI0026208A32|nr:hypothetical protein [uncultured Pseudokineococcus sp.]
MARGRRGDDEPSVVVDLEGLPRMWRSWQSRWWPWLWATLAVLWAVGLVMAIADDEGARQVVLSVLQVAVNSMLAVYWSTFAVRLEPTGYRVGGAPGRGELRPWSTVAEVRGPSRYTRRAEIRGTTAADTAVPVGGMTAEQADDLQRRLVEARARAAQTT